MKHGLIVDLDRCVGCHSCEISCKQEFQLPIGEKWITVVQVGPHLVDGTYLMDYVHNVSDGCTLCEHRVKQGQRPACETNCPTNAIQLLSAPDLLKVIQSRKHIELCKVGEI